MKGNRLRLALVLLLIMMNWLRCMFPDSWALGFWALVVDTLILLAILAEIIVKWLINRSRSRTSKTILSFLAIQSSAKTTKEIAQATSINEKKIEASLERLAENNRVDHDEEMQWHKVRF